jgi:hypothetical protein
MPDGRNTQSRYNNDAEATISPAYPEWYLQHGLRVADLLIAIEKGKSSEISKQIIQKYKNVVFITGRINNAANVIAQIYFSDSTMLRDMIEGIKALPFVTRVEFTEVVEIFGRKENKRIEEDAMKLLSSSGREW